MTTAIAPKVLVSGTSSTTLDVEPVCRVGGSVAMQVANDPASKLHAGSRVAVRGFRGYEAILSGRDFRDAIYLASRCCGYHGGQHAVAAAQAIEMAVELPPPPMAVGLRNMSLSAETIHAEAAHLILLAGPDLSAQVLGGLLPDVLAAARRAPAPNAITHGMATIADIMGSFDPITGSWYKHAFSVARIPYQMYAVINGKYPHPQSIAPGGMGVSVTHTTSTALHEYVVRLLSLVDPAKRVALMVIDLLDWLLATIPGLDQVGARPANLIDSGQWDDPEFDDVSYAGLTERGNLRWASPGVVLDGQLVTSDLREIAEGVEENVDRSFYDSWPGGAGPFEKRTLPRPGASSWGGRYSWSTAARWRGNVVETGPGARLWTTTLRGRMKPNPFIGIQDGALQLLLPEGGLPELVLEWRPPPVWNAIERTRARLLGVVFAALVAANETLNAMTLQKQARHQTSTPLHQARLKGQRRGVGFTGDGLLGHWMSLDGGLIENYQVVAPSTFNLGPGGPAEEALARTPVVDLAGGTAALVALRSFDPCANCAAH